MGGLGVLTTGIWILLYNPSTGIFRYLADLGIGSYDTAPLADPSTVFTAAVVAELWRGVPFFAILLLADLQTVSGELYEAASVDGASRIRRFFHITLPHLKDAIILSTLLQGGVGVQQRRPALHADRRRSRPPDDDPAAVRGRQGRCSRTTSATARR